MSAAGSPAAALVIRGVAKRFGGRAVLDGIDLTVAPGTLLAVLGRSGSGKTTLLRLVAGFERADGGTIAVNGEPVAGPARHVPPEHRRIGYVAQDGALFPHLTVGRNIAFGLPGAVRRRGRERRARVGAMLALVGLPADYADRWPQGLSGGEQQRVALARALAPSPRLVLLDEPFSSLDAAGRADTRDAVQRALAASGATAVMVTHDQGEALSMGHAVAVLRDGRLVQVATPERLYQEPADAALARFVGDAVLLRAAVRDGAAWTALGRAPLRRPFPDGPAIAVVRPEQVTLRALTGGGGAPVGDGVAGGGARPRLATVRAVSFEGADALVTLDAAGREDGPEVGFEVGAGMGDASRAEPGSGAVLRARVAGHRAPRPGDLVAIAIDGAVHACPVDDRAGGAAGSDVAAGPGVGRGTGVPGAGGLGAGGSGALAADAGGSGTGGPGARMATGVAGAAEPGAGGSGASAADAGGSSTGGSGALAADGHAGGA